MLIMVFIMHIFYWSIVEMNKSFAEEEKFSNNHNAMAKL
jgi:hypothetical protein